MNTTPAPTLPEGTPRPADGAYAIRTLAIYIERDGFRRAGRRDGLTFFVGGRYSSTWCTIRDADLPALDAARDVAYREVRDRQLKQRGY